MTLENFKLPLLYQNKIQKIDENVINDLELKKTKNHESIYNYFCNDLLMPMQLALFQDNCVWEDRFGTIHERVARKKRKCFEPLQ